MRRALAIIFVTTTLAFGKDPVISTDIPRQDVPEICALIARETRDPIVMIDLIMSMEPVPGAIAKQTTKLDRDGKESEITVYMRTDLLSLWTQPAEGMPWSYRVPKLANGWQIIHKSRIVD